MTYGRRVQMAADAALSSFESVTTSDRWMLLADQAVWTPTKPAVVQNAFAL
jgi:hypothetical protein